MHRLAVRRLPQPRVLHPHPENRVAVRYLKQGPYAVMSVQTDLCGWLSDLRPYRDRLTKSGGFRCCMQGVVS